MDFGQLSRHRQFDKTRAPLRFVGQNKPSPPNTENPVRLGAPQWTNPGWIGKIYPKRTTPSRFLSLYSRQWNSIELNPSFHSMPSDERVEKWRDMTPEDFRFFVKVFRGISHESDAWGNLQTMRERIAEFVRVWSKLGPRLGGFFLQLPPDFGLERINLLEQTLSFWPTSFPLAVEFRNPSWFLNRTLVEPVRELLIQRQFGTVITDTPGRRDVSHGTLTDDRLFVRFLGQSTVDDAAPLPADIERIESWADGVAKSRNAGLREQALFIHTPENFWVPELTSIFLARLRARGVDPRMANPTLVRDSQPGLWS